MSSVVYLTALSDPSVAPCFVLVDMQYEYIADSRLFAVPDAKQKLQNARSALYHARSLGLPVAHLRQKCRSSYFNPNTAFSGWIDGFEPHGMDMIFERNKPSCYSSPRFAEFMDSCGGHFVFAGFAGETACLATAIDAYHRGHHFTFLGDASASHQLGVLTGAAVHNAVTEIAGVYGKVVTTESWISETADVAIIAKG